MQLSELKAYEILKTENLTDIQSTGYILRHKKSGARVAVISNTDENKVFYIGFRTPPEDETGVPHIIEHTVLCGSQKFPVKDPFVELVKGSLNTFLNAMTYPDKTIYPVASCNDKDFQNLVDVYMDAVFNPNIYKHEEIFKQEGWHYELESKDALVTINGVVYNEMKGAYSSPDEILQQEIYRALYPDNTYSKNSGGNPEHIPDLTYEEYLNFHRRYYHPVNSYIYLYGDMDMAEKLDWMDKEYLSRYDRIELDSTIPLQKAFDEKVDVTTKYPISAGESEENKTYLSYNVSVANVLDRKLYQAFDILDYALVSAPGAPLKKALIDAGIGKDISGGFDSGSLQPVFSIVAKNANASEKEQFLEIIQKTLKDLVKNGINREALLAGINSSEFRFREADFGQFPKGLLYGIQCLDSWLFEDMEPFMHLQCLDTFRFLKEQVDTGYFENLIEEYLLNNKHAAIVTIVPEKGLNAKMDQKLEEKLAEYKNSLSDEEIDQLIEDTKHLKEYQEEPSPKEELEKIPMLSREDMRKEILPLSNIEKQISGIKTICHDVATNGIDYLTLMYDVSDIPAEDIPYLGVLKALLGYVDTKTYTYADLANAINIYSGGINCGMGIYPNGEKEATLQVKFEVRIKTLESSLKETMSIVNEILLSSNMNDEKRLYEILAQSKARLQQSLSSAGHSVSSMRALAGFSEYAYYLDATNGITYYETVKDLEEHFDEKKQTLIAKLKQLIDQIFGTERLLISFTGDQAAFEYAEPILKEALQKQPAGKKAHEAARISLARSNEAFTDASQIQYVAKVGNFADHGYHYTGALRILKLILSYDYLWINVRVKGGAYGCMSGFFRSGETYFVSYRDPNLLKTLEIYDGIPKYLREFQADERDMTKYIIGTFSSMDTPLYPEGKGARSMNAYLQNLTEEMLQKDRDEVRNATAEDIRALADMIQSVLQDPSICVIGNEDAIQKEAQLFDKVTSL
ncbi:insulinase family protein [Roseburia sp. MUC/MUC-530-WT-4D]|uniref:Insulinase family protein n=1 Tax=Roseburia porci TaxID=2605790 RepID=A0A6L5YSB2_9FIRM|nr:insulinase family protein [Roseburia porci]MST75340.1 insulinase family protein [Roseburia porci]